MDSLEASPLLLKEENDYKAHKQPDTTTVNIVKNPMDELKFRPTDYLPKLSADELALFQVVEENELEPVDRFLDENSSTNINSVNYQGLSALHLAVQNGNTAMVQRLLQVPGINLADTVLYAIQENHIRVVDILFDHLANTDPYQEFYGYDASSRFDVSVTPLIMAAHANQYEMVRYLIRRGHKIRRPHAADCRCSEPQCAGKKSGEDLLLSYRRVITYQALAAPAYIIQTSVDPVGTCFRLHTELEKSIEYETEFSSLYEQVQQQLRQFVVDFLDHCRSTEEVEMIIGGGAAEGLIDDDDDDDQNTEGNGTNRDHHQFCYPRLLTAIECEQKEFVTHAKVQQVLTNMWLGQRQNWRRYSIVKKLLTFALMTLLLPFSILMIKLYPHADRVRFWHSPINKWMNWVACYLVFLLLILLETAMDQTTQVRGPPDSGLEALLVFWLLGLAAGQLRQCWHSGGDCGDAWRIYDTLVTFMFAATFGCWAWAYIDTTRYGNSQLERKFWYKYDPTLLGEGLIAIASILAYGKTLYLFQMSSSLGPLQISLGKMLLDIGRFLALFLLLILSFGAGMHRLYSYYQGMERVDGTGVKVAQSESFVTLTNACSTLFWSMFGAAPLDSVDVVLDNLPGGSSHLPIINKHAFTETVGYTLFAVFHVICVVILMNMLIAVMSDTFEDVNDSADIEWKFARTRLWVAFIQEPPVPPPFNLLPSATSVWQIMRWCSVCLTRPGHQRAGCTPRRCCYLEEQESDDGKRGVRNTAINRDPAAFSILMAVLAQRYFRTCRSRQSETIGRQKDIASLQQLMTRLKIDVRSKS